MATLDAEIQGYEQALRDELQDKSDQCRLLNNLAVRLRARSEVSGNASDLDRALRASMEAVASPKTASSTEGPVYLNTFGNCLIDRFTRDDQRADLDAAIIAYQEAVDRSRDPDDQHAFTANLASALADRYSSDGETLDLNRAIELVEQLLCTDTEDPVRRAGLAANYAGLLLDRYGVTGSIGDIDHAVEVARTGLADAPPASVTSIALHTNLGGALQSRYDRLKSCVDLEAALREFVAGLEETVIGAPGRARLLNNIGIAYGARARAAQGSPSRDDMDQSIASHRLALDGAHADSPRYANGLAAASLDRYQATMDRRDVREAVRILKRVVAQTPPQAPPYARRLGNLARATALTFERNGRHHALAQARGLYGKSCVVGLETDPESTLSVGVDWGEWAMQRSTFREAAGAYELAAEALYQLFRVQLLRSHKEAWLSFASGIASGGAMAHARSDNPRAAVLALERGRALLLSEALGLGRADLHRLEVLIRPDLAARFRGDVCRLTALQSERWASR